MAMATKKKLLLRSAEGKVLMAPTWDTRPFAQFLPPLEMGASTRALETVIDHWTMHNYSDGDLSEWDLEFVRRLGEEEGLLEEAHAAAVLLQRQSLADLIMLFARSTARAERPCPCPDDVPAPATATPPRSAPATQRLRRKIPANRGRRPTMKRKILSSRPRKNTASIVSPATSEMIRSAATAIVSNGDPASTRS